jgi:hypothetical protein
LRIWQKKNVNKQSMISEHSSHHTTLLHHVHKSFQQQLGPSSSEGKHHRQQPTGGPIHFIRHYRHYYHRWCQHWLYLLLQHRSILRHYFLGPFSCLRNHH